MSSSILIISSFSGTRHYTNGYSAGDMLRIQHQQLSTLKHSLDKVLIVSNSHTPREISLFSDVLHRDNMQGSYGAWKDGYLTNPDYEWYFFLEDDYVFAVDNFDQEMIDMWEPDMTYLGEKVTEAPGGRIHAAISNGMTRGDVLEKVDWNNLPETGQYYSGLQLGWSNCFLQLNPNGMKDITSKYSTPFWTGEVIRNWNDTEKPALIVPVQML